MNRINQSLLLFFVSLVFLILLKSFSVVGQSTSSFNFSPQLVRSSVIFSSLIDSLKFKFVIDIPFEAKKSLKKIVIKQQPNQAEVLKIDSRKTKVFLLTDSQPILLNHSTTFTLNKRKKINQTVIYLFQAVPPGSRIEIVLHVKKPLYRQNVHRYDVIVYPEGDNPRSIDIGTANFYLGDSF